MTRKKRPGAESSFSCPEWRMWVDQCLVRLLPEHVSFTSISQQLALPASQASQGTGELLSGEQTHSFAWTVRK